MLAFGFLLLIAVIVLVVAFSILGKGSVVVPPIPAITGLSQFGVFYLMAQFVERVVEPLSDLSVFGENEKNQTRKSEDRKKEESSKQARVISIWCLASSLGIILCYFTIGLFQMVGVAFADWALPFNATVSGHTLDAVLSGVIIGGGTKPLHDVIGYIESKNP